MMNPSEGNKGQQ